MNKPIHEPDASPGGLDFAVRSAEEVETAIAALWHEWSATHNIDIRNQLVVHYAPLVRFIASRMAIGLPAHIDFGDLISSGVFGLISAIERFDLTRGIPFEGYASTRVRGAMLDELRAHDWVPRQVRVRQRHIATAIREFTQTHGRTPTNREIAHAAEISESEVASVFEHTWFSVVESLDEVVGDASDASAAPSKHEGIVDLTAATPEQSAMALASHEELLGAVHALPEREAHVIQMYYGEGMNLREIGEVLGVTESRVSQIRSRALFLLRAQLGDAESFAA